MDFLSLEELGKIAYFFYYFSHELLLEMPTNFFFQKEKASTCVFPSRTGSRNVVWLNICVTLMCLTVVVTIRHTRDHQL